MLAQAAEPIARPGEGRLPSRFEKKILVRAAKWAFAGHFTVEGPARMPRFPSRPATAEAWMTSRALPGLVARVAGAYGIDEVDFEDLLQETRIALWERGAEDLGAAWVLQVARHKAVDLVRHRIRARARDRTYALLADGRNAESEFEPLLHALVAQLPIRLRQFYDLRYVQGWSERDIATHLGKCRASVRWLDRTCRRAIVGPVRKATR